MKTMLAIIFCAVCLVGCGKRGKLDFPPQTTYSRQYPAPRVPKKRDVVKSVVEEKQPESIWEINQSLETGK